MMTKPVPCVKIMLRSLLDIYPHYRTQVSDLAGVICALHTAKKIAPRYANSIRKAGRHLVRKYSGLSAETGSERLDL